MWGAIGAIGGSLLGGLFGSKQQKSSNKFNKEQFKSAQALSHKQFQQSLKYNTAEAQKARQFETGMFNKNLQAWKQQFGWTADFTRKTDKQAFERSKQLTNQAYRRSQRDILAARKWDKGSVARLVREAGKAGIHPLAAMGGAVGGYSGPVGGGVVTSGVVGSPAPSVGGVGYSNPGAPAASPTAGAPSPSSYQGTNVWGDAVGSGIAALMDLRESNARIGVYQSEQARNEAAIAADLAVAQSRTKVASAQERSRGGTRGESTPSGNPYDALHQRGVYVDPVGNLPATRKVDIGSGPAVRSLNTDVFESEIASTINDAWIAMRSGLEWSKKLPIKNIGTYKDPRQ